MLVVVAVSSGIDGVIGGLGRVKQNVFAFGGGDGARGGWWCRCDTRNTSPRWKCPDPVYR